MKEKIKNFFDFVKRAWMAGPRGKLGIVLLLLALFFFIRLFYGTQNVQSFIVNAWTLNRARSELSIAQKKLDKIHHHIYLLQHPGNQADYLEEMWLKTLNVGDPEFKELKY